MEAWGRTATQPAPAGGIAGPSETLAAAIVADTIYPMNVAPVQPRGCTNFRLRRMLRAVSRHYDAHFARAGLKGTQFSLLSAIVSLEPVAPAELARAMGLDASTLTRNLRVTIEQGWVVQGPGDDARSRRIEATAAGRAKHAEARRHWKKAQLELNAQLGAERIAALHALIDEGLALLGDGDDAPGPDEG
jgi:DNA-binding MarR family transcriptional regulator